MEIELFKNGRTGLWTVFIVCPGAPKPSVGSNPDVKVSVNCGLEKIIASKKLSSGSARAVCVAGPKLGTWLPKSGSPATGWVTGLRPRILARLLAWLESACCHGASCAAAAEASEG